MTLWQAAFVFLAGHPSAAEPVGRDRPLVEALLVELYLVRQRPTPQELRRFLGEQGLRGKWADQIVKLWRRRLDDPARPTRPPAAGWRYPFSVCERLIDEHGIDLSITDALADTLAEAGRDLVRVYEQEPGTTAARRAERLFVLAVDALRLWAMTRDRRDDEERPHPGWPSLLGAPKTWHVQTRERVTRSGARQAQGP